MLLCGAEWKELHGPQDLNSTANSTASLSVSLQDCKQLLEGKNWALLFLISSASIKIEIRLFHKYLGTFVCVCVSGTVLGARESIMHETEFLPL